MISLKKFMHTGGEDLLDAYRRITALLMQAIALHCVEGETADYESFKTTVSDLIKSISDETPPQDVLIAAGTVSKAMQEYGRRTTQFIKAQSVELQNMIGMLTRTLSEISTSSARSISSLQEIERKLTKTAMIDDIRTLKLRMGDCLETVREECERQNHEAAQVVSSLRAGLASSAEQGTAAKAKEDPVTGFSSREQAESELKAAAVNGKKVYAAVFVVDRVHAINSRFGHAIGDKVMVFFAQKLTEAISASDRIFRWGDSSYLAILEREVGLDSVRRELGQYLFHKWEKPFDLGSRSVVLPISSTWLLLELSSHGAKKALTEIEVFVTKTVVTM